LRIDKRLYRVEVEQQENQELTEYRYSFELFEDGAWPAIWKDGGLPAPDKYDSIVGAIDMEEWKERLSGDVYRTSHSLTISFLGMGSVDATNYAAKLKKAGFRASKDWNGDDTDELYHYLRIDKKLYRVEVEPREDNELTAYYYSFELFEDGEWPAAWTAAGIPAPTFTAMLGKIDMEEFNEGIASYWGYSASIKLLGANLADYEAALKKGGFKSTASEYDDTWELTKEVRIGGKAYEVTVSERKNDEIPEIYVNVDGVDE
jgi:hypothetical protein